MPEESRQIPRWPVLWAALLCMLVLVPISAGSADAAIVSSQITEPADPSYLVYDATAGIHHIKIKGTTVGTGNVDINCYYGNEYEEIEPEVEVESHAFEVEVETSEFPEHPCVLRAVPEGETNPHPPGAATTFKGPRIGHAEWNISTDSESKAQYDFYLEDDTLTASLSMSSAGACGLVESKLYTSPLAETEELFNCNARLSGAGPSPLKRSEIVVDGRNAYATQPAELLFKGVPVPTPPPAITVTHEIDPSTGLATIHEVEPLVKCVGSKIVFPETKESCESFATAGVALERTWQMTNDGHVAHLADVWRSTDGGAHELDVLYQQEFADNAVAGGVFEFPGKGGFAETTAGETVSLPAGQNAIYYKAKAGTPDGGDLEHPQGAVVYDSAPGEALNVYLGSKGSPFTGFLMPYKRKIAAGGATTFRMTFVQAFGLPEVRSLAEAALATYPPSIAITSPTGGSTVNTSTATVTGTASDTGAIASVTVNGVAATLGGGGSWSAEVPLKPGPNTLTATATDQAGISRSTSVEVTSIMTPGPPITTTTSTTPVITPTFPAGPFISRIGSTSAANGKVTLTLGCTGGAPGSVCNANLLLTTTERLKGGKITGLAARSKVVTLARASVSIPTGKSVKVTLKPKSPGPTLLAHFKKLPALLKATTGARTLFSQAVTIKPAKKH